MLQTQMASKIVRHQVGITSREGRTHGADDLEAGVRVFGTDMFEQGRIAESHPFAVRTGERLWLVRR